MPWRLVALYSARRSAAFADYYAGNYQIVFYYDVSSGSADSQDFAGYGSASLCADVPSSNETFSFNAKYRRNLTAWPDDTIRDVSRQYNWARWISSSFSTSSSNNYHTYAAWTYTGNKSGQPNGYSRAAEGGTCTSP